MRLWQRRKRNRMSAGINGDDVRSVHASDENGIARKNESRRVAPMLITPQPLQPLEVPRGRTGCQHRRCRRLVPDVFALGLYLRPRELLVEASGADCPP